MRIITVIAGILLTFLGVFSIANAGLSFLSLAFPIGITLMLVGLVECFVYKRIRNDVDAGHWVLIDGLTTFILGIVVLTGRLAADIAVPVVFGMWSMISGIRGFSVLAFETDTKEKNIDFYWAFMVSLLNFAIGVYAFFNSSLLHLSVLMILGICFVVQGANIIKIGFDIVYSKPDLIKTKDEKIAEAEEAAKEAKKEMKKAIKKARKAKNAVKAAEEAKEFHEIISEPIGETNTQEEKTL
ncbi:MAG: DUF308 domain-containing protein [Emergencia sp.]|nr:DUF308 domain-containing protein [Emergencia sp.]